MVPERGCYFRCMKVNLQVRINYMFNNNNIRMKKSNENDACIS